MRAVSLFAAGTTILAALVQGIPLERAPDGTTPHFVVYHNAWVSGQTGPPDVSKISGFNTFILSFLLLRGPVDQATQWASLSSDTQISTKNKYAAAGIKLMVSAFGATDTPASAGADPTRTANSMASWVKKNHLDGIDVDFEDFEAINAADGRGEKWLITFTRTLRNALPVGQYLITHAPLAPWFSPKYTAGAYTKVHKEVGSLIDWYNIQFYNQACGPFGSDYTNCRGLLTKSSATYPKTSVFEISATAGVPLNKIVIGKPGTKRDANTGYIDPNTLAGCMSQGTAKGWNGGAMAWQFPNADADWIRTVAAKHGLFNPLLFPASVPWVWTQVSSR
ncbi:glycoside hydrolase family 18 protein [Hydnum rufescens UP504]|uniref:Glycoside hydrolase family 18 protein n=1 Tax=Hydnum rufescens UP504 TaxID=1448309 RepID=A0A9P6APL3_9AGAM|nr:glycoside hydrolase family 18 protein [Hydnum rufescens UP504]